MIERMHAVNTSDAGRLYIIDVNYFPSFKGIPEAPAALAAAIRGKVCTAT